MNGLGRNYHHDAAPGCPRPTSHSGPAVSTHTHTFIFIHTHSGSHVLPHAENHSKRRRTGMVAGFAKSVTSAALWRALRRSHRSTSNWPPMFRVTSSGSVTPMPSHSLPHRPGSPLSCAGARPPIHSLASLSETRYLVPRNAEVRGTLQHFVFEELRRLLPRAEVVGPSPNGFSPLLLTPSGPRRFE